MNKGKIVQVLGPVIDVEFGNGDLPYIKRCPGGNKRWKAVRYGGSTAYRKQHGTLHYAGIQ